MLRNAGWESLAVSRRRCAEAGSIYLPPRGSALLGVTLNNVLQEPQVPPQIRAAAPLQATAPHLAAPPIDRAGALSASIQSRADLEHPYLSGHICAARMQTHEEASSLLLELTDDLELLEQLECDLKAIIASARYLPLPRAW